MNCRQSHKAVIPWGKKFPYTEAEEVRGYFLAPENYCTIPLPSYYEFQRIFNDVKLRMMGRTLEDCVKPGMLMRRCKGVNYVLPSSKDGGYAWREFRLIHPVVYLEMARILTVEQTWMRIRERLSLYGKQNVVICVSTMPGLSPRRKESASAIMRWWQGMEQMTVKLGLYFDCVAETDVAECYRSMPLELVARAIGGEAGQKVARLLSDSEGGKVVGVPAGSVMGDFLAEMALGYLDVVLRNVLLREGMRDEYLIVRFRDDYRVFARDELVARRVVHKIAEVLMRYGMKLNAEKTVYRDDVLMAARKPDKVAWEARRGALSELSLQKRLMAIYDLAQEFPNSGSVQRALTEIYDEVYLLSKKPGNIYQLMSIVVNIMVKCPRACPAAVAILTKLMSFNPQMSRKALADRILAKVRLIPNADYVEIWAQRLTAKTRPTKWYRNSMGRIIFDQKAKIWNSDWLDLKVCDRIIVRKRELSRMEFVMEPAELAIFEEYNDDGADDSEGECDGGRVGGVGGVGGGGGGCVGGVGGGGRIGGCAGRVGGIEIVDVTNEIIDESIGASDAFSEFSE